MSFCAPTLCPSALSPLSFRAPLPIVILSEAKNLSSRLKGMVRKILRSEAPQNDRERGEPRLRMTAFLPCHSVHPPLVLLRFHPLSFCTYTPHCHSEPPLPLVILSEAKNLSSWLKDMVRKILRSEAPQNDRERGRAAPQNDSSLVILSEAKNLFSRLKDMVGKILRRCAPQNDRGG